MITGSAIIAPMVAAGLAVNPYLAAMALCLTTMCPSYLNDSYFHVVTNFSGMDIKTSLKTLVGRLYPDSGFRLMHFHRPVVLHPLRDKANKMAAANAAAICLRGSFLFFELLP